MREDPEREAAASLDELVDCGFTTEERVAEAKRLAWRVVSMLVALIKSLEKDLATTEPKRQPSVRTRTRTRTPARPLPDDPD